MKRKRLAVIGREPERSGTLRQQLSSIYPDCDIRSFPFISTEAIFFEAPRVTKTPLYLFTSPRAVEYFFESSTLPKNAYLSSIGHATTKALVKVGYEPHFTSSIENAKGMAAELLDFIKSLSHQVHIIQPTSNIAGEYLSNYFTDEQIQYSRVTTYIVHTNPDLSQYIKSLNGSPDWVLFYSPSGVRAWTEVSDERPQAFSIGPVTSAALRKEGWCDIHESDSPHESDILRAINKNYIIK